MGWILHTSRSVVTSSDRNNTGTNGPTSSVLFLIVSYKLHPPTCTAI